MSQLRKHYQQNRLRLRERRCQKFAAMRATKERLRVERAIAGPADDAPVAVDMGPMPRPAVEVRVRVGDRWFCKSAHPAPWGGLHPSTSELVRFIRTALLLA